ncbi:Uncharacterised protein [Mycolicibacterium vanbaalenii]|uniref:Phosphoglycolate phosphatase n=1 Tax=Mycolicibacterium vanbaalenii TaxID=110539 RepID=A0A5S9R4U2_MYCVN|nr:HAD family hydrolase [Mycolicibacterium vanbaalenii]CAA0130406.1 Uncharacterised protein [Mycolicibacterium vanbaalenii]
MIIALDFDGVICDGLLECAAVTWYAGHLDHCIPPLAEAVESLPQEYIDRFRSVRNYSRTLTDFMVANHTTSPVRDRQEFDRVRNATPAQMLDAEAAIGEQIRTRWRTGDFTSWMTQHTLYPGIHEFIARTPHEIAIVSAKDPASISAILTHHGLAGAVSRIHGSCTDKNQVLRHLVKSSPVLFIDDNLANVMAAETLPLTAMWAEWGYRTIEDEAVAASAGTTSVTLNGINDVAHATYESLT